MNYIAFHLPEGMGGIYGVAQCATVEENQALRRFARERGIRVTTGDLYTPEQLMELAGRSGVFSPAGVFFSPATPDYDPDGGTAAPSAYGKKE